MALQIRESYVDLTKGHRYGDSDWYTPYTDDTGRLYRSLRKEYGRCVSKMYVDTDTGARPVGWVFCKRMEYEDAHRIRNVAERTYLREVWVEYRHIADDPDADD